MPYVEPFPGVRINYRAAGAGFPLVFLHGWAMSSAIWGGQEDLAGDYRLIMPDLRGHGQSSAPATGYSFTDLAVDAVGILNELNLEKAVIIGWSMGAQVLLQAIPLLTRRIAGAVLVSGTPRFTQCEDYPYGLPDSAVKGLATLVRRDSKKAVAGFAASMFAVDESPFETVQLHTPQHVLLNTLTTLAQSDLRPLLRSVNVPVLLIHGSADTICLPGASCYMREALRDARLEIMTGVGHAPFISRAAEFNRLIRTFVGSCNAYD